MKPASGGKIAVRLESTLLRAGLLTVLRDIPRVTVLEIDGTVSSVTSFIPDVVIADILDRGFITIVRESCDAVVLPVVTSLLPACMLEEFPSYIGIYDTREAIREKISQLLQPKTVVTRTNPGDDLSPREKEVILGIVKGHSNKEIAGEMNVSVNTVMTHRRNIASKLQIHSAAGLTIYAITTGLVDIEDIKNSSFI